MLLRLHARVMCHLDFLELDITAFEALTFFILIIVIIQALLYARKALIIREQLILRTVLLGI
jgi:hypothetical protein